MDLEPLYAQAAAHAERRARIRQLEADSAATRADLAERRRARETGEAREVWQAPPMPAPSPAPAPALSLVARDAIAQVIASERRAMRAHVQTKLDAFADVMTEEAAKRENRLRDEEREARGKLLNRVLLLEAARDGRSLSRIYPVGAHHAA